MRLIIRRPSVMSMKQTSAPIEVYLPKRPRPASSLVILQTTAAGQILPADAGDLCAIIEAQRKAIELGDHEERLKELEAAAARR